MDTLVAKDSGPVDELYQAEVVTAAEMESIRAEVTSSEQNKMLLSVLSRKTKAQFDKFLDALDKTGQQHVRKTISAEMKYVSCYTSTVVLLLQLYYYYYYQQHHRHHHHNHFALTASFQMNLGHSVPSCVLLFYHQHKANERNTKRHPSHWHDFVFSSSRIGLHCCRA